MFESDADRLALIKSVGGEQFSTGYTEPLWAIFDRESIDSEGSFVPVKNRKPMLTCRESDVELHGLVSKSVVERLSDGSKWTVREFEPDGVGMVLVSLGA